MDEVLGPVAVSLRREKLEEDKEHGQQYNYRLIFRTSEVSHYDMSCLHPNLSLRTTSHQCFLPTAFKDIVYYFLHSQLWKS